MAQKYTESVVRKIVEVDTNNEYSLLSIESQGKKNPLTGKTMKRKMRLDEKYVRLKSLSNYGILRINEGLFTNDCTKV